MHNESKLTHGIALRSELGFDGGFYGSDNDFNYVFAPIPCRTQMVSQLWTKDLRKEKIQQIILQTF
ncbi:MAG: hypothetical protein CMF36_09335 [Leeuwenhoekiella sp.]|nr:hypothetical protein [Leeuwenhoekiella sp.]MBA81323.1 hypothetical protein [Leeuwenhoekiella sp.]